MSAVVSAHDLSDVTLWGQQIWYLWVPYSVPEVAECWGSGSTHKIMHDFVVPVCPMCSACHVSTHIKETGVQVNGRIAYNGETFDSFFAQRTAAYVDQVTDPLSFSNLFPACSDKHAMQHTFGKFQCQGHEAEVFTGLSSLKEQGEETHLFGTRVFFEPPAFREAPAKDMATGILRADLIVHPLL